MEGMMLTKKVEKEKVKEEELNPELKLEEDQ